jgi:hypothetical protein
MEDSSKIDYSSLKEQLKDQSRISSQKKNEEEPSQKAYMILSYIERPGAVKRLFSKFNRQMYTRTDEREYASSFKKNIRKYSKEDVKEVITYKFGKLEKESTNFKEDLNIIKDNIRIKWNYESSFKEVKDMNNLLSNRKFLRKKGITKEEIKEYNTEFKEKIKEILAQGIKYSTIPENNKLMNSLLNYVKKNKLIQREIKRESALEKDLIETI